MTNRKPGECRELVRKAIKKDYLTNREIANSTRLHVNTVGQITRKLVLSNEVDVVSKFDRKGGRTVQTFKAKKYNSASRVIRFDDMTEQVIAQARLIRMDYKSSTNYIKTNNLDNH